MASTKSRPVVGFQAACPTGLVLLGSHVPGHFRGTCLRMNSLRRRFRQGLFTNQDFVKLWSAETISLFGTLLSRNTNLVVAVFAPQFRPFQNAILKVRQITPAFLLSLY